MSEHQALVDRFLEVVDVLIALERQINEIDDTIAKLTEQGTTSATVHWRRKDHPGGRPDMLELVHRSGSEYEREHGRRREYIGTDPKQIKAALARCQRFGQVKDLEGERQRATNQVNNIQWAIKNVFRVARKEQKLWGQESMLEIRQVSPGTVENEDKGGENGFPGTAENGDSGDWGQEELTAISQVSPHARLNVSPRGFVPKDMSEVKAYFEQSPDLASIAKDLPG